MGSPSGTYRSLLQQFAPQRGLGGPHTSGRQGGTTEKRQETRNPSRSRPDSCRPPPAARGVVFHEDTHRENGGPHDHSDQRGSSTTDPRRRSKRPRTERAHIPTILTPAERERLAALHTGPQRGADGASSSSATSLPRSAANPLPGGQHATDTQPREPAADQRPAQGLGRQLPQHPPTRDAMTLVQDTGTDQPTNRARALRRSPPQLQDSQTARARRARRSTPGHPSPTSATPDMDRETMPCPPPSRRSEGARVPSTTRN